MISLVSPENRRGFLRACLFDDVSGAKMHTLLECYGTGSSICGLWLQTDGNSAPTAAISVFSGWLAISAGSGADLDELAEFAGATGGFRHVEAAADVCGALNLGGEYREAHIMRYVADNPVVVPVEIYESPSPREIYSIVCGADAHFAEIADFAGWYTHTSHLFRHGLGFGAVLRENGKPVSTGGVYATGERVAVIGCVATLPDYRGKGYAAAIVNYLAGRILGLGKTPVLICASASLAGYYERLGFAKAGSWGSISYMATHLADLPIGTGFKCVDYNA